MGSIQLVHVCSNNEDGMHLPCSTGYTPNTSLVRQPPQSQEKRGMVTLHTVSCLRGIMQ